MSAKRDHAAVIGVGVAACAVCCAGPILAVLAAIGLGTAAGFALFGSVAVVIGVAVAVLVIVRRRRQVTGCATADTSGPVHVELHPDAATVMALAGLVRLRWLVGTVLIVAAVLFAVGVASEGDVHGDHTTVESGTHNEASEHTEHAAKTEGSDATGEAILGINLESTPLVVLAVLVSFALAVATWRHDRNLILLATAAFAAVFAVLDIVEFSHQIKESAATVAAIAAVIAMLHAAAALLAEQRRVAARAAIR